MNFFKKNPQILPTFGILILATATFLTTLSALAFTDVPSTNPHNEAIEYLEQKGVIQGYADGTFRPDSPINRAEFLKILLEAKTPETAIAQNLTNCFPDVTVAWYSPYVCIAKSQGIVSGYPDGTFRPANNINLAEALKMVLETYGIEMKFFRTADTKWYEPYYWTAESNSWLDKINRDIGHLVTRGEMAQLIFAIEEPQAINETPTSTQNETNNQLSYYCNLFFDSKSYTYTPYLQDQSADLRNKTDSEETCKKYAEDFFEVDYDKASSNKTCYLSDARKSYIYDYPENVNEYSSTWPGYTVNECRELAINTYNTDQTLYTTINEGDSITLSNNIRIDIGEIEIIDSPQYESHSASIAVIHYLENPEGELLPLSMKGNSLKHALNAEAGDGGTTVFAAWDEMFGYRITLNSVNDDGSLNVHFTALTPYISSPEDLYNDCMAVKEEKSVCSTYSLFEPRKGEKEIKKYPFTIIGPENAYSYMQYFEKQVDYCYRDIIDFLGINTSIPEIPVHLLPIKSGVQKMDGTGIRWTIGPNEYKDFVEELKIDYCNNATLAHELVHAVVFNSPFSKITDEGLATYLATIILNKDPDLRLSCESTGYTLYDQFNNFGSLNVYEFIPYIPDGQKLYYTSACFWQEYDDLYGHENFQATMRIFDLNRLNQSYTTQGTEPISTFELVSNSLGDSSQINWDYFREKYGFNETNGGQYSKKAEYAPSFSPGFGGNLWDWPE